VRADRCSVGEHDHAARQRLGIDELQFGLLPCVAVEERSGPDDDRVDREADFVEQPVL